MPELPEVETVCRTLAPWIVGRRITSVEVVEPRLRWPVRTRILARRLPERTIAAVERRAKYILCPLAEASESGASAERDRLVVHLGMSGRFGIFSREDPRADHVHVVFGLDDGRELRFRDPRRFGMVDVLTPRELAGDRRFTALGVEPLSDAFSVEFAFAASRGRRQPVKSFLMDAGRVVGVGNIYASEALYVAGVHSTASCREDQQRSLGPRRRRGQGRAR